MKFKVGDKVKVVSCVYDGEDCTGSEGIITHIDTTDNELPYYVDLGNDSLLFMEEELELIEAGPEEDEEVEEPQEDFLEHILEPIKALDREALYEIAGYLEQRDMNDISKAVAEMLNRAIDHLEYQEGEE